MKVSKGKKLAVYFGCLLELDEDRERSKPRNLEFFADREEEVKAKRNKLIEKLNQSREVQDVSDLFPKLPSDMLYNPIFFKIHIPLSLQRTRYVRSDSENALVRILSVSMQVGFCSFQPYVTSVKNLTAYLMSETESALFWKK